MASFGGTTIGQQSASHNPNKDMEVPSPPGDSVSSLTFSHNSNLLVATSWNNQVLCWDVQSTGQAIPKAAISLDKPALCSAWSADGTSVFAGALRCCAAGATASRRSTSACRRQLRQLC